MSLKSASTVELIAMASGRKGARAVAESVRLTNRIGLKRLPSAGTGEIRQVCRGMSEAAATRLMAGVELGLRIAAEQAADYSTDDRLTSPQKAMAFCRSRFTRLANESKQEELWVVSLDTKLAVIDCHQVTVGTLRNSLVHPREVFRPLVADAANSFILVHNHPSGDPTPSDQDFQVTRRIQEAAELMGISLLDHIVVAKGGSVSIQEMQSM